MKLVSVLPIDVHASRHTNVGHTISFQVLRNALKKGIKLYGNHRDIFSEIKVYIQILVWAGTPKISYSCEL